MGQDKPQKHRKKKIPKALREAVWIQNVGRNFEHKCLVPWCPNTMTAFDFQTGHNIPESRGGTTTLENLVPICGRCNLSMSNTHTIEEWSERYTDQRLGQKPAVNTKPSKPTKWFPRIRNPFLTMILYLKGLMRRKATTVRPARAAASSTRSTPSEPARDKSPVSRASSKEKP